MLATQGITGFLVICFRTMARFIVSRVETAMTGSCASIASLSTFALLGVGCECHDDTLADESNRKSQLIAMPNLGIEICYLVPTTRNAASNCCWAIFDPKR